MDPETGDIYHMKFKPPTDPQATASAESASGTSESWVCPDRVAKRPMVSIGFETLLKVEKSVLLLLVTP